MRVGHLLAHLRELEAVLATDLRAVAEGHRDEHDVQHQCLTFAGKAEKRRNQLQAVTHRYGEGATWTSEVGHPDGRELLADLRVLRLRCDECAITWTMAVQAAKAARDEELLMLATDCHSETEAHARWFTTRIKAGAPQALVVE